MSSTLTVIWTALPNGFVPGDATRLQLSLFASLQLSTDNPTATLSDFPGLTNWTERVKEYAFKLQFSGPNEPPKPGVPVKVTNEFHPEMWTALFGGSISESRSTSLSSSADVSGVKRLGIKSYKKPVVGAWSGAEILSYPVRELAGSVRDAYGALAHTQTRVQMKSSVARDVIRAKSVHRQLVESTSMYLPPNPSEQERLATLRAIDALNQFVDALEGDKKALGLMLKTLFLGRISSNSGRDLRAQTLLNIKQLISERVNGSVAADANVQLPNSSALIRFIVFHAPGGTQQDNIEGDVVSQIPQFDFHEMLTMLSSYPVLLRLLGLVVDVEVPVDGIETIGTVRVVMAGPDSEPHPKTHYNIYTASNRKRRFLAKPFEKAPLVRDGMLDMRANGAFYLETMDVDGALLKQMALNSSGDGQGGQSQTALDKLAGASAPPVLRTVGISVIYSNRGKFLKDILARAEHNSQDPRNAELWAEDLIRGFRVDVCEAEGGKWYSLCERQERYYFLQAGSDKRLFAWPPKDTHNAEGTVHFGVTKPASNNSGQADQPNVLQQHEALFRWNNWSLCVPFPQKAMNTNANTELTEQYSRNKDVGRPLPLEAEFTVKPGSLPRQRFGNSYWLRCRLVDPAGNSLKQDELDDKDFTLALGDDDKPLTLARYEPVLAPSLLLRQQLELETKPGEQLDRMVVRDGGSATERCAGPPRATGMTAVLHGKYDDGTDRRASAFDGAQLDKQSGSFPKAGRGTAPELQSPIYLYQPKNSEPPDQPYLPDPLASAASVVLCDLWDQVFFEDFKQDQIICRFFNAHDSWPKAQPFLLRLEAAPSSQEDIARLNPDKSFKPFVTVARVTLRKGEIAKLKVSSTFAVDPDNNPDETNLRKMAFWRIANRSTKEGQALDENRLVQPLALRGEFPLYTPPRELTLVHAVKKPIDPTVREFSAERRGPGGTTVDLDIKLDLHRTSSGRVECEATWTEPIDDLSQPKCVDRHGSAHVHDEKIPLLSDSGSSGSSSRPVREVISLIGVRQNFGDTKHRTVTYTLRVGTRFREYYPQPPKSANSTEQAKLAGEERDAYTTEAGIETVSLPSTARPPAPRVAYVVPTFRWEQSDEDKGSWSKRWGGGLRIYLERPWYVSGEGELLGVVLYQPPQSGAFCSALIPHITQWGSDPIWGTRSLPDYPARGDFRTPDGNEVPHEEGLTLPAFSGVTAAQLGCPDDVRFGFNVVGFRPEFDAERRLWRCDLEVNPTKSYYPFIRLALARYQPNSLDKGDDCKLSPVVQAEFMQLTPDRWANLQYDADPHRLKLTVTGVCYQSRSAVPGKTVPGVSKMRVAVEQRCSDHHGDLGWKRIQVNGSDDEGFLQPQSVKTPDTETSWDFSVFLPRSRKVSHYRIVIYESEIIAQDYNFDLVSTREGERIVYADVLGV